MMLVKLKKRSRDLEPRMIIGASVLALLVAMAVFAPLLVGDPAFQDLSAVFQSPSSAHLLGTDDLGRDVLSRLVYGGRVSLLAASVAVIVAMVVGVPVGLIAGYFGGWVDSIFMRLVDTFMSFPALVLAVGVGATLGPGVVNSMAAVGIVLAPGLARLVRGQVLSLRTKLFVEAAATYGSSHFRVIRRHILPNVLQLIVVQGTLFLAVGLLAEAALSFLGLGVQPPRPSWGVMLRDAFQYASVAPYQIYAPGLAIAITVVAINAVGDSLRDRLEVRSDVD